MKKQTVISIVKFIVLVAIFYVLLALNVFHIGEVLAPSTKDYLETNIPTKNINIEDEFFSLIPPTEQIEHTSAEIRYEIMRRNLCNRIDICTKIHLNGEFTLEESFGYTRAVTALVEFFDRNNNQEKKLLDTLTKVDINKETGNRRGYATRDRIIINLGAIETRREFAGLLTHEMGHVVDLGYLQGTSSRKDNNFTEFGKMVFAIDDPSLEYYKISRNSEAVRKAEAVRKDFCSGYGMTNPFEDFSECFNLYLNHNIFFREIAKTNTILRNKYNSIAALVDGKFIASNTNELTLLKNNTDRRPRDTTKISN